MKRVQETEFKAIPMTYKVRDNKTKLLLGLIFAVILCAILFCFIYFSVENSRVNGLNSNLSNIQTESPESDSASGSTSSSTHENETFASTPTLTIQVVNGMTSNVLSFEEGIQKAQNEVDCFRINADSSNLSVTKNNNSIKNTKITINDISNITKGEFSLKVIKGINSDAGSGVMALMMRSVEHENKLVALYQENFGTGRVTFTYDIVENFETIHKYSLNKDKIELYAVFTRTVDIKISGNELFDVRYLTCTSSSSGISLPTTNYVFNTVNEENLKLNSINAFNCVFGAIGTGATCFGNFNVNNCFNISLKFNNNLILKFNQGSFLGDVVKFLNGEETPCYINNSLQSMGEWPYYQDEKIIAPFLFTSNIAPMYGIYTSSSAGRDSVKAIVDNCFSLTVNHDNFVQHKNDVSKNKQYLPLDETMGDYYKDGSIDFKTLDAIVYSGKVNSNSATPNEATITRTYTYYCDLDDVNDVLEKDTQEGVEIVFQRDLSKNIELISDKNIDKNRTIIFGGDMHNLHSVTITNNGTNKGNIIHCNTLITTLTVKTNGTLYVNAFITELNQQTLGNLQIYKAVETLNINSWTNVTMNGDGRVSTINLNGGRIANFKMNNASNNSTIINIDVNLYKYVESGNLYSWNFPITITSSQITDLSKLNIRLRNDLTEGNYFILRDLKESPTDDDKTNLEALQFNQEKNIEKRWVGEDENSQVYQNNIIYCSVEKKILLNNDNFISTMVNHSGAWDEEYTYQLTEDITLPSTFAGIGSSSNNFKGTLDGNGYMITFQGSGGLFNYTQNATICNLVVTGSIGTNKTEDFGGLITNATGNTLIYNIYMNATIGSSVNRGNHIGGMIRANSGNAMFINCVVYEAVADSSGGNVQRSNYVAYTTGKVNFINCESHSPEFNVDTSARRGLFVGYCAYGERLFYLYNCCGDNGYDNLIGDWYTGSFYEEEYTFSGDLNEFINTNNPYIISKVEIKDKSGNLVDSANNSFIDVFAGKEIELYTWYQGYMLVKDKISNQEDLASLCNGGTFAYRAARIISDITLTNWTGLNEFAGYLDGDNKTITFGSNCSQGLTKKLLSSGSIRNITFEGTINGSSNYVGAVAGKSSGLIIYCTNKSIINAGNYNYVGGIVGYSSNDYLYRVSDCTNYGVVTGNDYVGGIAGSCKMVSDCKNLVSNNIQNSATVTGNQYVGGIAGSCNIVWYTVENEGTVNCGKSYAGGLFGALLGDLYNINFSNTGNIVCSGASISYVGGLAGFINSNSTLNLNILENNCDVTYSYMGTSNDEKKIFHVGGVVGAIFKTNTIDTITTDYGTIENGKFDGTISIGKDASNVVNFNVYNVGGLVGYGDVKNSTFNGTIKLYTSVTTAGSKEVRMGGIVGRGSATNCTFNGNVELTGTNPQSFYYVSHRSGNAENCVFNADVNYNGSNIYADTLNIVGNTNENTTQRSAIKCFIKSDQTYILTDDAMANSYITYTNCSTFKSVDKSLVYNGYSFGSLVDALGDGINTYWTKGENGIPILTNEATAISKDLILYEEDNLNAINNLIENTQGAFIFTDYVFTFNEIGNISENFVGLGTTTYALKGGTFIGTYANKTENGEIVFSVINKYDHENVDAVLTNAPLFFNIENVNIYGIATTSVFFGEDENDNLTSTAFTPYASIAFMAKNSTFNNCLNLATIYSGEANIGGICALAIDSSFINCINMGDIKCSASKVYKNIGGIIGQYIKESASLNTISNCYSKNEIINGDSVGGLIGYIKSTNSGLNIANCITDGVLNGYNYLSGFIGSSQGSYNVINCISLAIINQETENWETHTTAFINSLLGNVNIYNSYYFGDILNVSIKYFALGVNTVQNCGYNINNQVNMYVNNSIYNSVIYTTANPVWSTEGYIRWLIYNETESLLNGTNEKLSLDFYEGNDFDTGFWTNVLSLAQNNQETTTTD